MTDPSVEWVLNQLGSVVDSVANDYTQSADFQNDPVELRRVDRSTGQIYDGSGTIDMESPPPQKTGKLERGCYVGAAKVSGSESPIGTEFDLDVDRVVGLRLEGLWYTQSGHVDPDGEDGVPFAELKRRVRRAIYEGRKSPAGGGPNVDFTHLTLQNAADTSHNWRDAFRWDVDIAFDGFETLP